MQWRTPLPDRSDGPPVGVLGALAATAARWPRSAALGRTPPRRGRTGLPGLHQAAPQPTYRRFASSVSVGADRSRPAPGRRSLCCAPTEETMATFVLVHGGF